jgi:nitric oxide reductase subunit C
MRKKMIPLLLVVLAAACSSDPVSNEVALGRRVFTEHCASCHSLDTEVVIVGPSLAGIASRAAASGDSRAFLEQAIKSPGDEIVDGFQNLMPPDFGAKLAPSDFEDLVAFLLAQE